MFWVSRTLKGGLDLLDRSDVRPLLAALKNLTLIWACANIQPTWRPLFYAQQPPFYTPSHMTIRQTFRRCCWTNRGITPSLTGTPEAGRNGDVGTDQL